MFDRYLGFVSQPKIILALIVANVLVVLGFQWTLPHVYEVGMLDMQPSYDLTQVLNLMEAYGADGRQAYAIVSPTLDTLFPIVYVSLMIGVTVWSKPNWKFLIYLPILAGLVDLAENAQITIMLLQFPELTESQVAMASMATGAKALIFRLAALVMIGTLILKGIDKIRGKGEASS